MTANDRKTNSGLLVFIPCYEEGDNTKEVAAEVLKSLPGCTLLIIDDGSRTRDLQMDSSSNVLLIKLWDNFGLGVCTHIAIDHMLRNNYKILVRIDADGQHPANAISKLISPIIEGSADVVVGIRLNHWRDSGMAQRIVKKYYSVLANLLTSGKAPADVNTGFFTLNRAAASEINKRYLERFPEPEIFITACRLGFRMQTTEIIQHPRRSGQSKVTIFQAARMFYRFNIFVLNELMKRGSN